jgi:hypothetical protein
MSWLLQVEGKGFPSQWIWCDYPRPQCCYLKYAPAIGISGWYEVAMYASYQGETWFNQTEGDPNAPWLWEAPGSEGRAIVTKTSPVYYILSLSGLKHTHPFTPASGQTGTGKVLESRHPIASDQVTWRTLRNYPGS